MDNSPITLLDTSFVAWFLFEGGFKIFFNLFHVYVFNSEIILTRIIKQELNKYIMRYGKTFANRTLWFKRLETFIRVLNIKIAALPPKIEASYKELFNQFPQRTESNDCSILSAAIHHKVHTFLSINSGMPEKLEFCRTVYGSCPKIHVDIQKKGFFRIYKNGQIVKYTDNTGQEQEWRDPAKVIFPIW